MKNNILLAVAATVLIVLCAPVSKASDGSSGVSFYEMVFGNPDQRNLARAGANGTNVDAEDCDAYGGVIGGINSFFCHMEKDMGITGVGSATKSYAGLVIHAEIVKNSVTVNGVTYNYQAEVWICNAQAADCTQTANFGRFDYVAYSYDKANGINKGYALSSPNVLPGAGTGASEVIYDVGSATSSKSVAGRLNFFDGTNTYDMRVLGSRTDSEFNMNVVGFDGTNGFRFAMGGAPPSDGGGENFYNMYFEAAGGTSSNGFYTLDTAGAAAPATGNGLCINADESGSATGITIASSSSCSSFNFGAFDYFALSSDGSPSAQGLTVNGILGTWQSMSSTPSAL